MPRFMQRCDGLQNNDIKLKTVKLYQFTNNCVIHEQSYVSKI